MPSGAQVRRGGVTIRPVTEPDFEQWLPLRFLGRYCLGLPLASDFLQPPHQRRSFSRASGSESGSGLVLESWNQNL
jgi:hypothetical protein